MKAQTVRLIDVFFIGPVLVYTGAAHSNLPDGLKLTLVGLGLATIIYNAQNYYDVSRVNNGH